ncbi:MAG: peptidoglycan DD-metalloendopeptidase family protein [Clostridia bacterium]|nr:peptidoglycan DD-metalloendopeptidase family protein [Clostridia bacterium]
MRFVRINRNGGKSKDCKRNSIATAKPEIDRCEKTDNKLSLNKFRFSFEKIVEYVKNKVSSFTEGMDKKRATLSATVVAALVALLIFNVNFTFAYTAFVDGVEVGSVPNKAYVQSTVDSVNSEFSQYVSGQNVVLGDVVCVPTVIRRGAYTDAAQLAENIKATSPIMIQAYAVEVNGTVQTALSDEESAKSVLARVLSSYKYSETTEVYFQEDVNIVYEFVPMAVLTDSDGAFTRLMGYTTLHHTVTVDAVVSAEEFAANNGMDVDYFSYLNPDVGEEIDPDEEVFVPQSKPVVTVMTCDTVTYDMSVPYEEQVTDDAMMYEGTERVIQRGVDGVNTVTEKIVRSNGDIVNQTIIHTEVVSQPVMQLRAVGTKPRPNDMGTGSFIRPYYGQVSSRFGSRSSDYHSGVDLCGSTGDPIKAADSGKVVFSGWSGGYGKIVKVDHGNGYVTYYAHCSELKVNVGDTVTRGQVIAAVGSTGNSSGPHLHFEIRYNDEPLNPMNYIN